MKNKIQKKLISHLLVLKDLQPSNLEKRNRPSLGILQKEILGYLLWHPKNFNVVLLIEILPGNLNFYFLDFLLISEPFFSLLLWSFYPKWKLFNHYWTCLPSQEKHFFYQWIYLHNYFSLMPYFCKNDFFKLQGLFCTTTLW